MAQRYATGRGCIIRELLDRERSRREFEEKIEEARRAERERAASEQERKMEEERRDRETTAAAWRKVRELEKERPRRKHYQTKAARQMCWNCYSFEHHYNQCPKQLGQFCRTCGKYGKTSETCPRCREGGYHSVIADRKTKN